MLRQYSLLRVPRSGVAREPPATSESQSAYRPGAAPGSGGLALGLRPCALRPCGPAAVRAGYTVQVHVGLAAYRAKAKGQIPAQ